ncbi:MAG: hypothetical protein Q9168_007360, partial [Polycauliona sp. 1 TL-2023]
MKGRPLRLPSYGNATPSFSNPPSRYICQQCRHRASLRAPALSSSISSIPFTRRTYATEPTLPDKFQEYFNKTIGKRLFKDGQIPGERPKDDEAKQPGEEEFVVPPTREKRVRERIVGDVEYKPATSGEELEVIGGPTGWWEKAWDEEYQFQGWMRPTPMTDGLEIKRAIERALVEWYTVEKGSIQFRETVGAAHRLWANNRSWELLPVGGFSLTKRTNGRVRLHWKRVKDRKRMQKWLLEPFQKGTDMAGREDSAMVEDEMEAQEVVEEVLEEDVEEAVVEVAETAASLPEKEIENREMEEEVEEVVPGQETDEATIEAAPEEPEKRWRHPKPAGRPPRKIEFDGLQGSINFHNPNLKFTVLKRVMQLTGIRIPDTTIQSIDSSHKLYNHLILKPKPLKLADLLLHGHEPTGRKPANKKSLVAHLPNVQVMSTKHIPSMAETALGRQKVIEQQLD